MLNISESKQKQANKQTKQILFSFGCHVVRAGSQKDQYKKIIIRK
jgi:hypothetical protein